MAGILENGSEITFVLTTFMSYLKCISISFFEPTEMPIQVSHGDCQDLFRDQLAEPSADTYQRIKRLCARQRAQFADARLIMREGTRCAATLQMQMQMSVPADQPILRLAQTISDSAECDKAEVSHHVWRFNIRQDNNKNKNDWLRAGFKPANSNETFKTSLW